MQETRKRQIYGAFQIIIALLILSSLTSYTYSHAIISVDDSFIIFRVAENLAKFGRLVFNPSDSHLSVTTPLFTIVLGKLHALFHISTVELSRALCVASMLIASSFLFSIFRRVAFVSAALMPFLIFLNVELFSDIGNEMPLYAALVSGALYCNYVINSFWLACIFMALANMTRSDAAILLFVLAAHRCITHCGPPFFFSSWIRRMLRELLPGLLAFSSIIAFWYVYSYLQFGSLVPSTLWTKIAQGHSGLWPQFHTELLTHCFRAVRRDYILAALTTVGIVAGIRNPKTRQLCSGLAVWIGLYLAAYSILGVPTYAWYCWPLYYGAATFLPLSLLSIRAMVMRTLKIGAAWAMVCQVACLAFIVSRYTGGESILTIIQYANMRGLSATAPHWEESIRKHSKQHRAYVSLAPRLNSLCSDGTGDLVASDEIGVIGYIARDCRFVDMPGILLRNPNPENVGRFTADDAGRVSRFIGEFQPRFLILREREYPDPYVVNNGSDEPFLYKRLFQVNGEYKAFVYERK